MRRAGVIGDPVEHSLSPVMHNAAMRALGIDGRYELWGTTLADLPDRIASLRAPDILGANVTVPHKQAVMPLLDGISDEASRIGAVNTIIPDGTRLLGDNTDAYGFRRTVELASPERQIRQAVILGAGGAARAVIVALQEMGVSVITLANRTPEKADALAAEFGIDSVAWSDVADAAFQDADILVNATALGWHDEMPVPEASLDRLPPDTLVMDLTYRQTPLLRAADARGRRTLDGLGMLIHQGARALELWTGVAVPVEILREAVLAEQARRA